jgi:hypothetical protein
MVCGAGPASSVLLPPLGQYLRIEAATGPRPIIRLPITRGNWQEVEPIISTSCHYPKVI